MFKRLLFFTLLIVIGQTSFAQNQPLKVAVIGLSHTHVHWIFGSEPNGDIEIVGIVEPNRELAKRYADQYEFPMSKVYDTMEDLMANQSPEAVTAFGTIFAHLEIVEFFAPRGIHIMVEKPLAVSMEHAEKMAALARKHQVHLLTNYETTWYPSNHVAYDQAVNNNAVGDIRKIIVRDGHKGPKKIGVDPEFLEWLTDPELNGGGSLPDFGCYGANLATWVFNGQRPIAVTAINMQLQPENNPKVEDETIILLEYKQAVVIVQASWNWPIGRKDMEIYGLKGALYANSRYDLSMRIGEGYDGYETVEFDLNDRIYPYNDPFAFFAAVVHGEIKPEPNDLSALENNLLVVEILEAAKKSAEEGRRIVLPE